jgi:1-deoxy-D-xylulose-5-phosphate reductoisomerase
MKKIAILGSTGSIGTQTLSVVDWHPDLFCIELICTNTNIELLKKQIIKFSPAYAVVIDEIAGRKLARDFQSSRTQIVIGMEGLLEVLEIADYDMLLTAVSGAIGLRPTIAAINKGVDIALANKETLVAAGEIVMALAQTKKVKIIPVDSEHSAIFQCLQGEKLADVHKLILTASGGPFKGMSLSELTKITPQEALKHPKWNMGTKISIDSATLMNKGLEIIEARWLFGLEHPQLDVVVHPQSIIHSMVQFVDGSLIAHLGPADMRIPIQYALTFPNRLDTKIELLDLTRIAQLTFEEPDREAFPALDLAYQALQIGGTMPAILNGANEIAVSLFLENKISFLEIPQLIDQVMKSHKMILKPDLNQVLAADQEARILAKQYAIKVGGQI